MAPPTDRTAVLVLRVWLEPDSTQPLRARLTHLEDLASPGVGVATAASVEDTCAAVRAWLEDLLAR